MKTMENPMKTMENPIKTMGKPMKTPMVKNPWVSLEKPRTFSFSDVGAAELGRKALQLVCRQRDSADKPLGVLDFERGDSLFQDDFRSYRFYLEEIYLLLIASIFSMVIHGVF